MATVEPAEEDSFFQDVESQMADIVDTPESFLTPSAELEDKLLQVTKQLFDFGKTQKIVTSHSYPCHSQTARTRGTWSVARAACGGIRN